MKFYSFSFFLLLMFWISACNSKNASTLAQIDTSSEIVSTGGDTLPYFVNKRGDKIPKISKTETEWETELTPQEFYVLRKKGTERAGTGDLLNNKVEGLYVCRGCGMPLFSSKTKFESGTGWPSFYDVLDPAVLHIDTDYDLGYGRSELTCAKCGGHQGHVFNDGPEPTGLRYCINAVSLDFVKAEN